MSTDGRIPVKSLPLEVRTALQKVKGQGWQPTGSTMSGGHLADIPEPRIRLADIVGYRKQVSVKVYRWQTHYFIDVEEEDDYFWHPTGSYPEGTGAWCKPWDGPRGRAFHGRYARYHFVGPFIERTIEDNFPRKTHWIYMDRPSKEAFVYSRTGD